MWVFFHFLCMHRSWPIAPTSSSIIISSIHCLTTRSTIIVVMFWWMWMCSSMTKTKKAASEIQGLGRGTCGGRWIVIDRLAISNTTMTTSSMWGHYTLCMFPRDASEYRCMCLRVFYGEWGLMMIDSDWRHMSLVRLTFLLIRNAWILFGCLNKKLLMIACAWRFPHILKESTSFAKLWFRCYDKEYFREPNAVVCCMINELRGFSEMLKNIDCMHWKWKNRLFA
jgi:hypothetical protein